MYYAGLYYAKKKKCFTQNQGKTDGLPVHQVQESHWPPKENENTSL